MADITACDNCGKQSPDKSGLHIANDWMQITVHDRGYYFPQNEKLIFCNECIPRFSVSNREKGASIIALFFRILRIFGSPSHEDEWNPIESAPKDGNPILVCIKSPKSGDRWQDVVCYNDIQNQFMAGSRYVGHDFITHWMPLPKPPSILGDE